MIRSYIAIGSNLMDPVAQVERAIASLASSASGQLVACSGLYCSPPMGGLKDQAHYINAVATFDTTLAPLLLLDYLQGIEQQQGRQRDKQPRWGPRTLDLDLLLYSNRQMQTPRLTLPHYGLAVRPFVLYPLAEIAPALILPDGTPLLMLLSTISAQDLQRVASAPVSYAGRVHAQ